MSVVIKGSFAALSSGQSEKSFATFESLLKMVLPKQVMAYYQDKPGYFHSYFDEEDILRHVLGRISHYKGLTLDQIFRALMNREAFSLQSIISDKLKMLRNKSLEDIGQTCILNYIPTRSNFDRIIIQTPQAASEQLAFTCDTAFVVTTYNQGQEPSHYGILVSKEHDLFGVINLLDVGARVIELLWTKWIICGRHPKLVHIGGMENPLVSRAHSLLGMRNGKLYIVDLASKNGVSLINDEELKDFVDTGKPVPHKTEENKRSVKSMMKRTIAFERLDPTIEEFLGEIETRKLVYSWNYLEGKSVNINMVGAVVRMEKFKLQNPKKVVFSAFVHLQKNDSIRAHDLKMALVPPT